MSQGYNRWEENYEHYMENIGSGFLCCVGVLEWSPPHKGISTRSIFMTEDKPLKMELKIRCQSSIIRDDKGTMSGAQNRRCWHFARILSSTIGSILLLCSSKAMKLTLKLTLTLTHLHCHLSLSIQLTYWVAHARTINYPKREERGVFCRSPPCDNRRRLIGQYAFLWTTSFDNT